MYTTVKLTNMNNTCKQQTHYLIVQNQTIRFFHIFCIQYYDNIFT